MNDMRKLMETIENISEDSDNEELPPIHAIARDVIRNWKKVHFSAVPYLDAMQSLNTRHDDYGADSGSSILAYGLGNMNSYGGRSVHDPELAKKHRAQLKRHLNEMRKLMEAVEEATDGKKVDMPVDFVMRQLQQKVTETAYKAQQFSSYIKRNYPEEKEKYNVAVEVEMELDRLRKMIFEAR